MFSPVLMATSCAVGPDFKKPEVELPSDFYQKDTYDQVAAKLDLSEDSSSNWWDSFNDSLLVELVQESSSKNLSILQAVERIEQARAASRQTFFGLFPTPTITGQYLKSKVAGVRFPGIASDGIQFELYSAGLEANWEIDLFGKIRRAVESADSLALSTAFNLDDTLRLIHAQIATAYMQLRGAQLQRKLTSDNIAKQREILSLIEKRFEAGSYSPFELERSKSLTSRSEALLSQYDALIDVNIHRIAALTGRYPAEIASKLKVESALPEYAGGGIINSPEELIRRRPDVKVAEQSLHAATADIGVAVADLFPQISISGSVTEEGRKPNDWFGSNSHAYTYGPRVSWSILNLGAILNNISVKKARSRELLLKYKETIVLVIEEVENAITELNFQNERLYHLNQAFSSSRKAEEIAQIRFKEGTLNYLDLLTAQQELISTESEFADAKTRRNLAFISLYRSLGGEWSNDKKEN